MTSLMMALNKMRATKLLFSLFLTALLWGCSGSLVDVFVSVDTCQGPRPPIGEPPGGGACWQGAAITSEVDAYGAYIAGSTTLIQDHNHKCTSGNKKGGGSCNFIPCVWKFTPSADPMKGACTTACRWW